MAEPLTSGGMGIETDGNGVRRSLSVSICGKESEVSVTPDSLEGLVLFGGLLLFILHSLDQPDQMTSNPLGELPSHRHQSLVDRVHFFSPCRCNPESLHENIGIRASG